MSDKRTGNPLFARLPSHFHWSVHNLIAHPLSEVLHLVGFTQLGSKLHDWTIPEHTPGEGHG